MPGGRDGGGAEEADAVLAEKGFGLGGEMPDTGVKVAEAVEAPGDFGEVEVFGDVDDELVVVVGDVDGLGRMVGHWEEPLG